MSAASSTSYPLGGTQAELDRLLAQAAIYEPETNWLLDQIGVGPGWRAVDIGCGPIGILNLLSQRVGTRGSVVGLEPESHFVAMAHAEIANPPRNNVTIAESHASNTALAKTTFD